MIKPKGFIFILKNWKQIIHLLLHTRRFGVNNCWMSDFDSILSQDYRGLRYVVQNYKAAKLRATVCGFLTREECESLGWKPRI